MGLGGCECLQKELEVVYKKFTSPLLKTQHSKVTSLGLACQVTHGLAELFPRDTSVGFFN